MHVLVIGGTGTVGRHLVKDLAQRGVNVRVGTRSPSSAANLPPGVTPVHFEFDRPETFVPALAGVRGVFLMASAGEQRPLEVGLRVLAAMREVGVQRVVNMTGLGIERNEAQPLRQLELAVERSGLRWTHLRPNFFLQNFCTGALRGQIVERGELAVAAGDARISFVDARDIAAVAAEALVSNSLADRALAVTGAVAVTYAEIAQALTEATGRRVAYRPLDEEEARRELAAAGLAAERVEARLGFLRLARSGAFASISPDVEAVLGRAPRSVRQFATDCAATWQPEGRV